MNLFLSAIFQPLGWTLLHFIWQGAVIAVLFGLTLIPLSRYSARVRYLVACGFLAAMAVCPIITCVVIKTSRSIRIAVVTEALHSQPRQTQLNELGDLPRSTQNVPPIKSTASPAIESKNSPNNALTSEATVNRFDKYYRWIEPVIPYTVVLWLGGVGALSLRLLLGWVVVVRLRRNASAPEMTMWVQRMELLASHLRVNRSVKLVESALVEVPTVIGWMRPMILIPTSAFTGLTTQQLEAILAHELAHIRRHDFLVNLVQSVIETLLFYHPAVWWLSKRIREEREHCCDDLAISVCDSRREYIRALVEMESLRSRSLLVIAANGGSLLNRTRRLLQPTTSDIPSSASWGASLLAIGSLLLMLSLAYWIAQPEIAEASEPQHTELPVIEFRIAANDAGSNSEPFAPADWDNREFRDGRSTETSGFEPGFVWFPLQTAVWHGNEGAFQVRRLKQVNEYVKESGILLSDKSDQLIRPDTTWSALTPKVVVGQKSRGLVDDLGYAVQIQLTGMLHERIASLVRLYPNRILAVIVNGEIIGHTILNTDLASSTKVDVGGYFTKEWAEDLVRQINGENPDPLEKPVWFSFRGTLQSALDTKPTDRAYGSREIPVIRDVCMLKKIQLKVDTASIKAANIQLDKPFRFEAMQLPLRKALDGFFAAAEVKLSYRLSDDQTELIVFAPPLQTTGTSATVTSEKPAEDDDGERKVYTHPITVSGRALDEHSQPIADAKIYLISVRTDHKRVAETVTDAKGRYEFKNAPLPIEPAQRNSSGNDHGAFEVFGSKPGKAFSWRPLKVYYPVNRHAPDPEFMFADLPNRFYADDPIELDLHFGESKTIKGRIVDEAGTPLVGVRIELRRCEKLQSDDLIERGVVSSHHQLEALNQPDDIPGEVKKRVTDSDGRFAFTDVPAECEFSFNTSIRDYSADDFYAATTERELPAIDGVMKIHTKEVLLRFARTVDVPIKVVFGDTGQPAPKVFTNINTWSETNENGIATLKLAPGTYKNQYLVPARGTRFLVTELEEEVVVTREPPQEPFVLKLKPACELDVTIVDADTGQPIPDVDLWMSAPDAAPGTFRSGVMIRSFEAPNLSHFERPKSNKEGKLRALVEPGRHRFGVVKEFSPAGYQADQTGQLVDCPASEKIEVTFKLKRIDANTPK